MDKYVTAAAVGGGGLFAALLPVLGPILGIVLVLALLAFVTLWLMERMGDEEVQDAKTDRTEARTEGKSDRTKTRVQGRTDRTQRRQDRRENKDARKACSDVCREPSWLPWRRTVNAQCYNNCMDRTAAGDGNELYDSSGARVGE